ncbi:competence type IV pilus major pilin ComGC [Aquibacillus salsiterrae]|uniref:ComG operon protein 3 n=1 Tax=Aquibacillus salsiterrae TaxID=2950439 RepID=A0A9X4AEZ1_9BACI|nr:competence type IV pilus major pilin ComGC [Aquibacillus salsiterrae]MDC3415508.1 prepilin-type N-terminal cleavage/methylation domain-containing protein [Aquibacillus salsiterrae]
MKKQNGFTLIEMLIVLTVISTLLILLIPNLADKNTAMQTKGCDALLQLAESQIQAYKIDTGSSPLTIQALIDGNYLKTDKCANNTKKITLTTEGVKVDAATQP